MSTEKFEPFGEPLPGNGPAGHGHPKAASAILGAVGQYSFWLLVVVIVFSRIAFFSPVPSFVTHAMSGLILSAQR